MSHIDQISKCPNDWNDADWDTFDLEDSGEPPCPGCGAFDSVVSSDRSIVLNNKLICLECNAFVDARTANLWAEQTQDRDRAPYDDECGRYHDVVTRMNRRDGIDRRATVRGTDRREA